MQKKIIELFGLPGTGKSYFIKTSLPTGSDVAEPLRGLVGILCAYFYLVTHPKEFLILSSIINKQKPSTHQLYTIIVKRIPEAYSSVFVARKKNCSVIFIDYGVLQLLLGIYQREIPSSDYQKIKQLVMNDIHYFYSKQSTRDSRLVERRRIVRGIDTLQEYRGLEDVLIKNSESLYNFFSLHKNIKKILT